ncbi:MoaD/ThiS family protein [Desulfurococcus amylolyticus]|uniref:Thiamine S protein n=1 Tax=Desulfurococcus amylolyticus DSM 16532 TaxID=768672 RepID=I3XS62_DESAM|nr:MoaD/ThiS family protein [Desulfurococcus amylolyticus]AFL66786.1 thiamine S protein [Desulfurococcus amylolyticus DSM 16532]
MKVRVRYMLWLESKAGTREEVIELNKGGTLRGLLEIVSERHPGLAKYISELLQGTSQIIVLHNSKTPGKGLDTVLMDMDTVVLMPPVSGG